MDTTLMANVVLSCSMSLPVLRTRTFRTGTVSNILEGVHTFLFNCWFSQVILFGSVKTSLSFFAVTRSMSRSAKWRLRLLHSIARKTSSTTTSRPNQTTTSRNRFCGLPGSWLAIRPWYVSFFLFFPLFQKKKKITFQLLTIVISHRLSLLHLLSHHLRSRLIKTSSDSTRRRWRMRRSCLYQMKMRLTCKAMR